MKTIHLSFIMFVIIILSSFGLQPAHADNVNDVYIQNIKVQPSTLKVGDTFTVTTTLINNSTFPIILDSGTCYPNKDITHVPFFTVVFDNHATIKEKNGGTCAGVGLSQILNSGKNTTQTSPDSTFTYIATESGTANITVSFSYYVKNQTDPAQSNFRQTISKSFLFTILADNAKAIPYMSPQDLYKQSEMVFYGQVISVGPGSGPDFNYYLVKSVTNFKNPQTSNYITVEGHKTGAGIQYPQFEAGDNAIFYIQKIGGINTISPYSQKAGQGCDVHSFLGAASIQDEPIARGGFTHKIHITNSDGNIIATFLTNHQVVLTYDDVWNNYPESRTIPIELSILDFNSQTVLHKTQVLGLRACDGPGTTQWDFVPIQAGKYTAIMIVGNKTATSTAFDVENNSNVTNTHQILSPLKQLKSGIKSQDVKCREDLMLITKASDSSPACVKSLTYNKLALQGWAKFQGPITTTWVIVNGTKYDIPYVMRGWTNQLVSMTFDSEHKSLLVFVKSTAEKGEITLTIPRALLDSNLGQYAQFIVLVDGQETKYTEVTSATARMLTIPFGFDAQKIEIIAPQRI